ncbi:MAG: PepSY domain-containing protein [Alphaproteobacteria bacterium]
MNKFAVLAAATAILCSGSAFAEEQYCTGEGAAMPTEQVMQKLETMGYQKVKKLDMEHGCYEAKGFDAEGNRVEVYLEPATGEVVKVKKS